MIVVCVCVCLLFVFVYVCVCGLCLCKLYKLYPNMSMVLDLSGAKTPVW